MSVYFYSKSCEGCSGNRALAKMKQVCEEGGVKFQERRTILWDRFEQEADEIMELNPGLQLPFFYNSETGQVLHGNSFTPLEEIERLIET